MVDVDAARHRAVVVALKAAGALPAVAEVVILARLAKIILRRKQVSVKNRPPAKKTNIASTKPSAKTGRVTKTKMFHPLWTKRPKAKALPKR